MVNLDSIKILLYVIVLAIYLKGSSLCMPVKEGLACLRSLICEASL